MTSLQPAAQPYAPNPFNSLPSCRFHQENDSTRAIRHQRQPFSTRQTPGPLKPTAMNTDWNTAFHHTAGKLAYANAPPSATLPLHTDPEMYALRTKYSSGIAEAKLPFGALPSVTVKQTQHVNNRLAYVEALVDTNAHVIETIWSSSSSHYNKSAVVPLRTFIQEVLKRSRTTYSTLQTALFYLFRARPAIISQLYERGADQRNYPYWQDAYISCGRRMFLASLVIASKFVQDKTYRNSAWAKIAGLPVAEINVAERIFLELIDYRLYIAQPTFEQWHHLLHMHVESRALNRPMPLLHDLSCLPAGLPQQLPSPTSPEQPDGLPGLNDACCGHCHEQQQQQQQHQQQHQHQHQHQQHQQPPRRKRRLRDSSISDDRGYSVLSSPPPSCSPSSSGATGYSPPVAGNGSAGPPVLSLSLPSSSSSSPMHTPTQISPVRINQAALPFTWKMGASSPAQYARPYLLSDVRQQTDLYGSSKKRSAAAMCDYSQGYAVSHVRGMKRKQRSKSRHEA